MFQNAIMKLAEASILILMPADKYLRPKAICFIQVSTAACFLCSTENLPTGNNDGLFFPTICFSKFPKYNYSFPGLPDATSELTSRHWRAGFCLPYSKYEHNWLETVQHLTRSDLPYNEAIMGEKRHQTSQDSILLFACMYQWLITSKIHQRKQPKFAKHLKSVSSQWQILQTKSIWPKLTNGITVLDQITTVRDFIAQKGLHYSRISLGCEGHFTSEDHKRPYQLKHLLSTYKV